MGTPWVVADPGTHVPASATPPRVDPPRPDGRGGHSVRAIEAAHPEEPHWYLAVVGTEPRLQHQGIGSALLAPVLERCDRDFVPAYLESSREDNVAFYQRLGFEVTTPIDLPGGGPRVWPMWRDPRP